LDGQQTGRRVIVVCHGNRDRVDLVGFGRNQFAVVGIDPSRWKLLLSAVQIFLVNIAQRNDIFTLHSGDVSGGAVRSSDATDLQLAISRFIFFSCDARMDTGR